MTTTERPSAPPDAQRPPVSTVRFPSILGIPLIAVVGFLLRMGAAILGGAWATLMVMRAEPCTPLDPAVGAT